MVARSNDGGFPEQDSRPGRHDDGRPGCALLASLLSSHNPTALRAEPTKLIQVHFGRKEQTLNSALAFDGEEYIQFYRRPVLSVPFTQEAAIYPNPADEKWVGIIGNQPDQDTAQRPPSIWVYQNTKLLAGFGNGQPWLELITEDVLVPEHPDHIAVTFDGDSYKVYVNGSSKHDDSQTFKGTDSSGPTKVVDSRCG